MGVSLLHARKPNDAFDCLIEAVQLHHRDPLLWLRLAECCIQAHKPVKSFVLALPSTVATDFIVGKQKRFSPCGKATRYRKNYCRSRISPKGCLVVTDIKSRCERFRGRCHSCSIPRIRQLGSAQCRAAFEQDLDPRQWPRCFAYLVQPSCSLLTVVILVTDKLEKEETDSKEKPDLTVSLNEVSTLSKLRNPLVYRHLKNAILADAAYVALCLGDYLTSLRKAKELLKQPQISGNHQ